MKFVLSELINIIRGGTPKTTVADYWNRNIPWLSLKDGTHDSPKPVQVSYSLVTSKHLYSFGVDLCSLNQIHKDYFDKINKRSKVEYYDKYYRYSWKYILIISDEVNFAIKMLDYLKLFNHLNGYIIFIHICKVKNLKSNK